MILTPRRRWFQFGLRGLLVFFVFIAAAAAWVGNERRISNFEMRVAEQLEADGARVQLTGLFYLSEEFDAPGQVSGAVSSWWRKNLSEACGRRIRSVNTATMEGRFDDLSRLSGLSIVTSLNLSFAQLNDLEPIAEFTKLESLNLNLTAIDDLSPLAGLKSLVSLSIDRTPVSDLTPIAGLKNLERLHLWGTKVRDLAPLAGLQNLTILSLGQTPVNNLAPLTVLKNLQYLDLSECTVSDQEVERFRQASPTCLVKFESVVPRKPTAKP